MLEENLLRFVDERTLKLIFILIVSIIIWGVLQLLTRSIVVGISEGTPRGKRLRTLSGVIKAVISTLILGIAVFEALSVVGFDIAPLLASAGVVGLAVGFGAQTLVKDVISGFFMLVEDQFDDGDEVEIGGKKGIVERITLRTIWIRDKDDTVHVIPNGTVTVVSNFSRRKGKSKGVDKKK